MVRFGVPFFWLIMKRHSEAHIKISKIYAIHVGRGNLPMAKTVLFTIEKISPLQGFTLHAYEFLTRGFTPGCYISPFQGYIGEMIIDGEYKLGSYKNVIPSGFNND